MVAMVKRGVSVTDDKREKIRWLLLMNNKNPERYPQLFTSNDDVVGELLRVYEEVKGEIRDPHLARSGQYGRTKVTLIGMEEL